MGGVSREQQAQLWEQTWSKLGRSVSRRMCLFNILIAQWIQRQICLKDLELVEVGGVGQLSKLLSASAKTVTCLDFAPKALELARTVCRDVSNVNFIQADLFDQQEANYDVAISIGLIEHYFAAERRRCMEQHARMARRYVIVGAPSDLPHNWWRSVATSASGNFPPQTPISEAEMNALMHEAGIAPLAMTRIDPGYGHRLTFWRLCWRVGMRLGIGRSMGIDNPKGGILVGIGKVRRDTPISSESEQNE